MLLITLISVYNSDGCVGRCDARCYNADGGACDCVCGGRNHGAGLATAAKNTEECAELWLERYANEKGLDPEDVKAEIGLRRTP